MFDQNVEFACFAQVDLKAATVTLKSGNSKSMELKLGEGNCSWTETHNRQYTLDRGKLDEVRDGDETPLDLKLAATFKYITATGTGSTSPRDALLGEGTCDDWTSSDTDECKPYAVDVELKLEPPCTGADNTYLFPDFRVETIEFDVKAGTISFNGKCNVVSPTLTVA